MSRFGVCAMPRPESVRRHRRAALASAFKRDGFFVVIPSGSESPVSPRFEPHTASLRDFEPLLSMNDFGARPFPDAIWAIELPEATERSSCSSAPPSSSRANLSRCLIRSQLLRLPVNLSLLMHTSTQLPLRRSPSNEFEFAPAKRLFGGAGTLVRILPTTPVSSVRLLLPSGSSVWVASTNASCRPRSSAQQLT
jgi:hypothetical protein